MWRGLLGSPALSAILSLMCLLVATPATGQFASQSPTADRNATYSLFGTVVNSVTGAPIKRALIEIYAGNPRLAFSDGNGQFEFDNLPPGETAVNVRKPGFFSEKEITGAAASPTMTKIGPDSEPLNVKLVPQSVITGHVQNVNGEPLEQVPVKALTARIEDGRRRWVQLSAGSTNEDGEFRLANLTPGSYYLQVGPSSGFGDAQSEGEGYPALFYPGVPDMGSATMFEVAPGQQVNADLSLRPVPLFKVSGRISGYTGAGVGVNLVDHLGNSFSFLRRLNPATGEFEAQVPAGSYTLQAWQWSRDARPQRAEIPLNVNSAVSGVAIALGTVGPIPVIVRTEDMRHEQLGDRHSRFDRPVNIHLIRSGDQIQNSDIWSGLQGAPTPSLVIPDAVAGTYSVEFMPNSLWYVQSAQCGATDLLREPLAISAGAQTPPIEVVLRNDGATVSGQIGSGQMSEFATVLLVPDDGSGAQIKAVSTGADGHFAIGDLAPGGYSVLAVDRAGALEYRNRQVLEQYLSRATHVTLDPNGRHTVHLDLVNVGD